MSWLEDEEKILNKEIKEKLKKDLSTKNLIWFFVFIGIIFGCQIAKASESIICPYCECNIELETPKAREVPGAGWYCDNCGQFQCHGKKCAYCGCKR